MNGAVERTVITRDNIDNLLDRGQIEVKMGNGNWWQLRRNGATKLWKRDETRIRIPVKAGFRATDQITENDFAFDATLRVEVLNNARYRVKA